MPYFDSYQCKQGDVLDAVCYRHYGTEVGTTEAVLKANFGLANYVVLPVGLVILLPRLTVETKTPEITLPRLYQ